MWEENGNVVAMLSFGNTADHDKAGAFEIWRIYITSDFQGKGIGHNLIAFAEQAAKEEGYTEVVIWAFKNNLNAISFTESMVIFWKRGIFRETVFNYGCSFK